jgi:Uma2 family endonuclease
VGYELSDTANPIPDASYISKERLPTLPKKITVAPDVAVEVVSPSETYHKVMRKVAMVLRYGTCMVLVVDQDERTMAVHTSEGSTVLTVDDVFDGRDVMPGFQLAVRDIFPKDDSQ